MTNAPEEHATLFVTWTRDGQTVREHFGMGPGERHALARMLAEMVGGLWKRGDVERIDIERGDRKAPS